MINNPIFIAFNKNKDIFSFISFTLASEEI